jgi:hypothetical protein
MPIFPFSCYISLQDPTLSAGSVAPAPKLRVRHVSFDCRKLNARHWAGTSGTTFIPSLIFGQMVQTLKGGTKTTWRSESLLFLLKKKNKPKMRRMDFLKVLIHPNAGNILNETKS